ncbi:MAG TPA: ATP-binding cassette domain-containing protein [Pseudogracilibacillus sp.]|nr:ATP-binding cassette domain-containing protein [Pseudogracilibacillus sp.]
MGLILSVRELEKSFQSKKVLHRISFDVREGEVLALLGPNGAGKSTTIRTLMDILYPDNGSIHFHFHTSGKLKRNKIGYLPEERGLYRNVKVIDMLLYLAELKDYPLKKAKDRIAYYLEKFDLTGQENRTIETLSKGMAQKIQFIGTIIHEPKLLILDEPFSGLDPVSQELLKQEVRELAKKGTAIILSSHQMNVVEEMCDRIFLIHEGKQVLYGTLEEIKLAHANMKCIIYGQNNKEIWKEVRGIENIEHEDERTIIYIQRDTNITEWIRSLPEQLYVVEMSIERVSLHEIFIAIATEKYEPIEGVLHA